MSEPSLYTLSELTAAYSRCIVLCDTNTKRECYPLMEKLKNSDLLVIEAGEEHKNIDSLQKIWSGLLNLHADRNSLLICLGGGMVCDIGGMAAATYKRGIPVLYIPTTLLAQTDAAIGGKTGIDFGGIKNSIGTFTEPVAVINDRRFLKTLPHREWLSGFAEILKHGFIADTELLEHVLVLQNPEEIPESLIQKSVNVKKSIVQQDPSENGIRKILNFGHTIGHAMESISLEGSQPLRHGEAIAAGMLAEMLLSETVCGYPEFETKRAAAYICRLYRNLPHDAALIPEILQRIRNDKKNRGRYLHFSLLSRPGECGWDIPVDEHAVHTALTRYFALIKTYA